MIGIFDSGVGGLTVVKEIFKLLPEYQITYFGDTARTPYGIKSKETVIKYAIEDANFLIKKGVKIIIIACNTASAVASDELKNKFPNIPIFEVITPAVKKALEISNNKKIGIIGTRATINSNIYKTLIHKSDKSYTIISQACPLFVPLAEEGWINKPVTKSIVNTYLSPLKQKQIDTLILGCTHYPLLKTIIKEKAGKQISLVDPAEQTSLEIKKFLKKNPEIEKSLSKSNEHSFFFSDITPHLSDMSSKWLGQQIILKKFSI
ncbi:MAG: glutamate racemase [Candidatus Kerfeldbacteria bacterium]|jgi:glutamate racemase